MIGLLKKYHEITLKDVILLDATKSASVLKKYWFIPLWLCRKELELLAKQIFESIGGKTIKNIQDEFDEIESYRKLQILESLFKIVQIEFDVKSKINAWKIILQKDFKESPILEEVIEKVKKYTDIQIETPENLKDFIDYVRFRIDKHAEMFHEEEVEEKQSTSLITVFNSYFNAMNQLIDENMRLITFLDLKNQIEDRIKSQKTEENGQLE